MQEPITSGGFRVYAHVPSRCITNATSICCVRGLRFRVSIRYTNTNLIAERSAPRGLSQQYKGIPWEKKRIYVLQNPFSNKFQQLIFRPSVAFFPHRP